MIRVSKYPMIVISIAIIGFFVLPKLHYPSHFAEDVFVLLAIGFASMWSLKYGCEMVSDAKQIKGELTARQRMRYRTSINMLICGILGILWVIFFALFQSSFRISDWFIIHWGLKGH